MKNKLIVFVKYFKFLYLLYYHLFNFAISVLKLFVKPDDKLILINSFGGKKYDDSPKALYEAMIEDERFKEYKFVWAFHKPSEYNIPNAQVIKTDTLTYFITALKARCWISNSTIERGLNFKGKNTFYFNTWHGTPIKKMGTDISKENKSFSSQRKSAYDIMTAQSDFEADIFSRVFNLPRDNFLMCGLPRNDFLANYTQEEKDRIKEKLGLPNDKKIILYAPTFREFERDSMKNCVLIPPMNLKKWQDKLQDEFCILFRAHYEVGKVMQIKDNDFVKNMTSYPSLNELMVVTDILISDYSSIFFDFSVMDKVMLHFTYDYDAYSSNRGMYFDIREKLSGADNEDDLINLLKMMDYELEKQNNKAFKSEYLNYYGSAVQESLDCIINNIGECENE